MIARIKTKDNVIYDTIVFAIIDKGWKTKLIGFDEKSDKIEIINFWGTRKVNGNNCIARYVFIIDCNQEHWVTKNNIKGYEWIINNQTFLNKIENRNEIDFDLYQKCKEMQLNIKVNEWNNITTNEDISNVLNASLGFHDSVVEKIDLSKGENIVEVTFDTTWECKIIIRFEDDVEYRCEEQYGEMGEIFGGSIFIEEGFIYWVSCEMEFSKEIEQEDCYFKSRKASWKVEIY